MKNKYSSKNGILLSLIIGTIIGLSNGFDGMIMGAIVGSIIGAIVYSYTKFYLYNHLIEEPFGIYYGSIGFFTGFFSSLFFCVTLYSFGYENAALVVIIACPIVGLMSGFYVLNEQKEDKEYEKNRHNSTHIQMNTLKVNGEKPIRKIINNPITSPISSTQKNTNFLKFIKYDKTTDQKEITKMEYSDVYEYLIDIARNGCNMQNGELDLSDSKNRKKLREQKIIVTYGDVLGKFGKKPDDRKSQTELFKLLDKINENSKPILLSTLVVNKTVGKNIFLPGNRFFKKWMPNTNENDKSNNWNKELEKIWQHYCK